MALWAGDEHFALRVLSDVIGTLNSGVGENVQKSSCEQELQSIASKQVIELGKHFTSPRQAKQAVDYEYELRQARIVETANCRGMIHDDGFFGFELRGFFVTLDREKDFFLRVDKAFRSDSSLRRTENPSSRFRRKEILVPQPKYSRCREWIDIGEIPPVHISVGELCMISARMGWCCFSDGLTSVKYRFSQVLKQFDL
jgi:hypothetical protein